MRKIFFILIANMFITCGSSKIVQQNTLINTNKNPDSKAENTKKPKPATPSEEKASEKKHIKEEVAIEQPFPVQNDTVQPEPEDHPIPIIEAFDHSSWSILLQKHVASGGTVDYKGFKQDHAALKVYLNALGKNIPNEDWTTKDRLAYWMNVYNAFTIKLIIDNYPLQSIKDIKDPWDLRFFKIGKKWYTLNDVEHRILRKMGDPRIHFGINCASFSCPPLLNKAFTRQNVNEELEKLTVNFINDPKRNKINAQKVELSKIFSWFAKDFKGEGSLIDFLNKYSKVKIDQNAKKSFKKYDWTLNE